MINGFQIIFKLFMQGVRPNKWLILYIVLLSYTIVFVWYLEVNYYLDFPIIRIPYIISGLFLVISALTITIIKNFNRKTYSESDADAERQFASNVESTIRKSEDKIKLIIDNKLLEIRNNSDEIVRSEIAKKIEKDFSNNIAITIGDHLQKATSAYEKRENLKLDVNAIFSDIVRRPLSYADAAKRQSETYKWIAIILAILGLAIAMFGLWMHYEIFQINGKIWPDPPSLWAALWRHAPLFSVVILTEFLALILFRYATKSQETMKYFANETVNFQAKQAALQIIIKIGTEKQIVDAANALGLVERNTILKDGERTIEKDNMDDESSFVDKAVSKLHPLGLTPKPRDTGKSRKRKA